MRIIFMGTPDFAVPCLKALLAEPDFIVCAVFTQPDKPKGRKQVLTPPAVKTLALAHGIPVYQPETLRRGDAAGDDCRAASGCYCSRCLWEATAKSGIGDPADGLC